MAPKSKCAEVQQSAPAPASTSVVPLASAHEKNAPHKESITDRWPKSPNLLRRVLKSNQFYSLVARSTKWAWFEAIRIYKEAENGEIDCNLVPYETPPIHCWLNINRRGSPEEENEDYRLYGRAAKPMPTDWHEPNYDPVLVIKIGLELFEILRQVGIPPSSTTAAEILEASDAASLSYALLLQIGSGVSDLNDFLTDHKVSAQAIAICGEMKRTGQYPTNGCLRSAIGNEYFRSRSPMLSPGVIDSDGLACQMIRLIPKGGSDETYRVLNSDGFIQSACWYGADNVLCALLEHLPVLEFNEQSVPKGVPTGPTAGAINALIRAGHDFMAIYRRDRSVMLRETLADLLAYDVFDLIDAYGAK
jgi:hypothetical protein